MPLCLSFVKRLQNFLMMPLIYASFHWNNPQVFMGILMDYMDALILIPSFNGCNLLFCIINSLLYEIISNIYLPFSKNNLQNSLRVNN